MSFKKNVYDTMRKLISVPSISGTKEECAAAEKIYEKILEIPYFKDNPENLGIEQIEDDPLGRSFVWAVVNGKENSSNSFILSGHLDVVGVEEFGHLKSMAFDVDECTKRISELNLDEDAMEDFKSGDWIFGRGTADMKFGVALNMELLREFSKERNFKGNLLLLVVPGEESNSEGMIAAAPFLLKLKEERKYNYCGMIISEPSIPERGEKESKRLYIGSVGKIMPLFFCVGKETHVGESLRGLNPNLLVSEINKLMECNPDLSDSVYDTVTPPPMCLKQMDLKEMYSVQSPLYSTAYYNILTLQVSYDEILSNLKELAQNAFENVLKDISKKREKFAKKSSQKLKFDNIEACVITYKEMLREVKSTHKDFEKYIDEKVKEWKNEKMDNQTIAINIVKATYELYENKRPMIIISFIPPYYPHKYLKAENSEGSKFINAVDSTIKYAGEKFQESIIKTNYFMGISDASYTGIDSDIPLAELISNIVGYDIIYKLPVKELSKLNIPVVIFGGQGKDLHKYTERLNVPYSFEVIPKLYRHMIYYMLR
ncbi:succinyl-diaminopimelate desuccinylase [Clostridium ragsdalei P11]|uniref:Succinyl-diaminopimelate desuccinylase n=1 Tax=Clostridium ragsdalei P11 TaxID=1353534 RepID=A0A1A6B3Q3_9CLOT|nr:M20/M25/M40 family metallo-hydrolase [Clostridium ragsdalei]OBR96927.1 succinyl-diaminopimelate desuccinylase [Clostridium ragsdalei P11]